MYLDYERISSEFLIPRLPYPSDLLGRLLSVCIEHMQWEVRSFSLHGHNGHIFPRGKQREVGSTYTLMPMIKLDQ